MVFSSLIFLLVYFPLTLLLYYALPGRCKNIWLVLASFVFYASGEPKLVFLLLTEVLWNWAAALALSRLKTKLYKKLIMALCLSGDLGVLLLFKYSAFFMQNVNIIFRTVFLLPTYVLPIGISFYTFQEISYVVDVYRGEKVQKNPLDIALYLSFFPQLIAGPIVRYREFAPQLHGRKASWDSVSKGFIRFCVGLCKKILLANQLSIVTDLVFNAPSLKEFSAPMLWLGAFSYSLQLFFDFSGYSDMAIGLGAMFGFHLPENFRDPYTSRTIKELWNRWHISLFNWFRDYVYIPLGGSRMGKGKTIRNLLIVWALTGMWHGANWTFVLWGFCWGTLVVLERFFFCPEKRGKTFQTCYRFLLWIVTAVLWSIFRAPDVHFAFVMLGRMFSPTAWVLNRVQILMLCTWWHEIWLYFLVSLLLALRLPQRFCKALLHGMEVPTWFESMRLLGLAICMVLSLSYLVNGSYNPFLYFQF